MQRGRPPESGPAVPKSCPARRRRPCSSASAARRARCVLALPYKLLCVYAQRCTSAGTEQSGPAWVTSWFSPCAGVRAAGQTGRLGIGAAANGRWWPSPGAPLRVCAHNKQIRYAVFTVVMACKPRCRGCKDVEQNRYAVLTGCNGQTWVPGSMQQVTHQFNLCKEHWSTQQVKVAHRSGIPASRMCPRGRPTWQRGRRSSWRWRWVHRRLRRLLRPPAGAQHSRGGRGRAAATSCPTPSGSCVTACLSAAPTPRCAVIVKNMLSVHRQAMDVHTAR